MGRFQPIGVLSTVLFSLFSRSVALVPTTWNDTQYDCKCYHGDDCWPSQSKWQTLNSTVNGNLFVDVPPGAVCHNTFQGPLGTLATFDAAECANVTANFFLEQWTTDQPAAELWTYGTNETCRPTTDPADPCTLGFYGVYVILAQTKEHIKAGVDFAREHELRLIIRNTGHDFLGRSTGWGALVINTHSFQDIEFTTSYAGPGNYTGGAVTIGAGVQGRALLGQAFAQDPPVTLVTGECPTVGVAGGLVQGAGHGPLTTLHGFAADNALSFDAITADGEYVTANEETNPDLYWALKGGGPSAFAVILSATFRTFLDIPSTGFNINVNSTLTNDTELFWQGVSIFHSYANHFVDSGLYGYFELGDLRLHVQPLVGIGLTAAEMNTIVAPMLADLDAAGVPYDAVTQSWDTFYELYIGMFEDEVAGVSALTGGWMFAHEDVAANNDGIVAAYRTALTPREDLIDQGFIVGHLWDAGHGTPVSNSATNPRFRSSSVFSIVGLVVPYNATWDEKEDLRGVMTNIQNAAMREAGPNGCGYVNEGDPYQPDWQDAFWGTIYPDLYSLRNKWDPNGVFYSVSTPGTEDWDVIDYGTKLCKRA
ncbi:hypothetical protein BX600DRAFT_381863 [Xylariales sp. PMI_506]|nr:hypothetical protein BX600DRAFT_381863 [Xylariales sp. PMI_506]